MPLLFDLEMYIKYFKVIIIINIMIISNNIIYSNDKMIINGNKKIIDFDLPKKIEINKFDTYLIAKNVGLTLSNIGFITMFIGVINSYTLAASESHLPVQEEINISSEEILGKQYFFNYSISLLLSGLGFSLILGIPLWIIFSILLKKEDSNFKLTNSSNLLSKGFIFFSLGITSIFSGLIPEILFKNGLLPSFYYLFSLSSIFLMFIGGFYIIFGGIPLIIWGLLKKYRVDYYSEMGNEKFFFGFKVKL